MEVKFIIIMIAVILVIQLITVLYIVIAIANVNNKINKYIIDTHDIEIDNLSNKLKINSIRNSIHIINDEIIDIKKKINNIGNNDTENCKEAMSKNKDSIGDVIPPSTGE